MSERILPRVAIVGYPNVGKSTLFNRLTGTREAVVAPEAGVTRDRKEGAAEWRTRDFVLLDTGGIDLQANEPLSEQVRDQARLAIAESAAVIFLVDGRAGVGPQEHEIADLLRRSDVPVTLAVNKIDSRVAEERVAEFWELGLGEPIGISAEHGMGTGDLLDAVVAALPAADSLDTAPESAKIAIVGRPNVGKSSLTNALLGSERVIVSPIPGTTRDAIDTQAVYAGRAITLVDTAGLRRRGRRTTTDVEYYSGLRALKAMERSDVALVVVDASEGLVDLDLQVAYEAQRAHCATAVLFNKWDVSDEFDLDKARERLFAKVQMRPPSVTVSAKTGRSLDRVLPLALSLYDKYRSRIPTADLNKWLEEMRKRSAPQRSGKTLKLFYIVQYDDAPPRFKIMVNSRALLNRSYAFFLENRLREAYELWGIPLVIDFEGKEERYS